MPGLVFGQLVTNTGDSAYQFQNFNGNALEHALSWEHADIAEKQQILSDVADKIRLEAAQKVEAEKLAQEMIEEEQAALLASKEAEVETNQKAKIDQQQQTNEQFRNTQQGCPYNHKGCYGWGLHCASRRFTC